MYFLEFVLPYVRRINSLKPTEVIEVDYSSSGLKEAERKVAGGVYGFLKGNLLELFAPGSFFSKTEWTIKTPTPPHPQLVNYCFCPSANVVAFAENL